MQPKEQPQAMTQAQAQAYSQAYSQAQPQELAQPQAAAAASGKKKKRARKRAGDALVSINSPVILGLTAASALALALNTLTGGAVNSVLMSRFTSWLDVTMYLRFFTYVIAHADFGHFVSNYMLILVVGPMMEERYGRNRLLLMLLATAFATGVANAFFFRNVAVIGSSGLAFMLVLLASFVNIKKGGVPLTLLIVGFLYIGNEVMLGILQADNVSRFSHIIGGLCGAGFGFYFKNGAGASRVGAAAP